MTTPQQTRWHLGARLLTAMAIGAVAALVATAPASAIPPSGPSADTPGTSSSVSPSTLSPGETIRFTVSGYPAGETLYVKIDDGVGYGDTSVQGSGVWHSQAIPSSGTVSGSFALPADIAPGAHWLRFLASKEQYDANGKYQGVLGFTRRGGADFTVVPTASGGGAPGTTNGSGNAGRTGGGAPGGGQAPAAGQVTGTGADQTAGQGGVLSIDAAAIAPAETEQASEPSVAPAESAAAPDVVAAASTGDAAGGGVPVVGIAGAGVLVAGGAVFAWLLLRRRGSTPTP